MEIKSSGIITEADKLCKNYDELFREYNKHFKNGIFVAVLCLLQL